MDPINRFVMCCYCNRRTLDTIRSAGFEVTELEQTELPKAPPFVRPLIVGTRASRLSYGIFTLSHIVQTLGPNREGGFVL